MEAFENVNADIQPQIALIYTKTRSGSPQTHVAKIRVWIRSVRVQVQKLPGSIIRRETVGACSRR